MGPVFIGGCAAFIVIGMLGLVAASIASKNDSEIAFLERRSSAQDDLISALRKQIAALEQNRDAAENLAAEREKSLVIYRSMFPPDASPLSHGDISGVAGSGALYLGSGDRP